MTRPLLKKLDEGKLYYSISEVCQMTGLEPHVLRYWETEFRQIKPKKNRAGNRAYRSKEIKFIRYLRYLLHDEKFTLQGAKKKMSEASLDDVEGQLSLLPPAHTPTAAVIVANTITTESLPQQMNAELSEKLGTEFRENQEKLRIAHAEVQKLKVLLKQTRDALSDLTQALESR